MGGTYAQFQRKMRIIVALFSFAISAFWTEVQESCRLRRGRNETGQRRNETELCPDSFSCALKDLSRRINDGERFEDAENCKVYSCRCSYEKTTCVRKMSKGRRRRGKCIKGCYLYIADNRPYGACSYDESKCKDVNTDKCQPAEIVPREGYTMQDCGRGTCWSNGR